MDDLIRRSDVIGLLEDMILFGEYDIIASSFSEADEEKAYRAINGIPAINLWIPCSERMPENRERVLVCFRSGTVHIAVWYGDYDEKGAWKVTSQFPTKLYRTDTIPKWMPMPDAYEPPKEGDNNDQG